MRLLRGIMICWLLTSAAQAHDSLHGITNCYGYDHCPQDTLVLGTITRVGTGTFSVRVSKTLRGAGWEGRTVELRSRDYLTLEYAKPRPLRVGDAVLVSFARRGWQCHQPAYLVRASSDDWRTTRFDLDEPSGDAAALAYFVHSGGTQSEFLSGQGGAHVRLTDGRELLLFDGQRAVAAPVVPGPPRPVPPVYRPRRHGLAYACDLVLRVFLVMGLALGLPWALARRPTP